MTGRRLHGTHLAPFCATDRLHLVAETERSVGKTVPLGGKGTAVWTGQDTHALDIFDCMRHD